MESDAARQRLETMLAMAADFPLVMAGVQAGLFRAVAERSPVGVTPDELATGLGYRADQVRIWAETLYAIGLLDEAGDGRLRLTAGYEPLLVPGPPGVSLVPAITMRGMFLGEQLRFADDLRTGAERPMVQQPLTPEQLRGMLPNGQHQARARLEQLYQPLTDVVEKLQAGARVLEVGCRLATQSLALVEAFPAATILQCPATPV